MLKVGETSERLHEICGEINTIYNIGVGLINLRRPFMFFS